MADFPYRYLIQRYFPASQWENAECISRRECSPDRQGYPASCIGYEGWIDCGQGPVEAHSWGIFQVLDACWNPAMNPNSPFTPQQWAQVLDPNVNIWMASVIWSRSGWGAWTTCGADYCNICDVPGAAIPYPRGPVTEEPPIIPIPGPSFGGAPALVGVSMLAIAGILLLT